MAQEATKAETKAEAKAEAKTTAKAAEPAFSLDSLQTHCKELFGVTSSTFAGATNSLSTEKKYTIAEVKTAIDEWGKKEAR
jgi:hypothetical protein